MMALYGQRPHARRVTTRDLQEAKNAGEKWPMLTCYDAMMAATFDRLGVPVLLVGDSAANVVFGYDSTLPVSVDEMLMLTRAVTRGAEQALVVADLPFGSYQQSPQQALATATRFMKDGRAHAVKLEGGDAVVDHVRLLTGAGIPVMGHVGLTPQSVHALGGYRVQGRGESGDDVLRQALLLEEAGAFAVVLELIPAALAERITKELTIPVIGIGAGSATDAQVLVWQDLLGLTPGRPPKFVRRYAQLSDVIDDAVNAWARDVASGNYPDIDHRYD